MKRRLLIIVLALILAGAGTSGVVSYVHKANARALAGMKPVSVLVAQKAIPSGTTAGDAVREGLLASETLPASSVPANALASVPRSLDSLTFSAALPSGQLLLRPMLVQPTELTSGLAIPPGMMAVTIDFCLSEAVAGSVQAGSEVAVFDTMGAHGGDVLSAQPGCSGSHEVVLGGAKTRTVLTKVLVLSVGQSSGQTAATAPAAATSALSGSSGGSVASAVGSLVTLAVTQAQAEQLIQLTEAGMPYLALLSSTSRLTADAGSLFLQPKVSVQPTPVLTFPVVTPSANPTLPAPSTGPTTPAPQPHPTKTSNKRK